MDFKRISLKSELFSTRPARFAKASVAAATLFALFGCESKVSVKLVSGTKPASELAATLTDVPTGTNKQTSLDVTVAGSNITDYKYALISGSDCSTATYSEWTAVATHITGDIGTDGEKTICALGRDTKTNSTQETPTTATWTKDTTSPIIAITSPAAGTYADHTNYTAFTISGTCDEGGLTINLSGAVSTSATCNTGIWSASLDLTAVTDGPFTVSIDATDATGNAATSDSRTFNKNLLAATLTGAPTGTNNATTLNVTVGGTNITEYKYDLVSGTDCTSASYGSWTAVATPVSEAPGADGSKILCVIGRNASLTEQATPTTASWTKDTAAPTATLTGAPTSTNNTTTLDVTVGGTGVTEYQYDLVSGTDCTSASYGGSWTTVATHITEAPGADGSKTLCVIGRDAATNAQVTATSASWTKDTVAPTAALTGAPTGTNSDTTLDVTVGGAGVTEYQYDLVSGTDCTSASYGSWTAVATHITEAPGADGSKILCVIGRDTATNAQTTATTASWTKAPVAATPTFSVSAGTYHSAQTVTLSTTTSGATIRYTTDGSTPSSSSTAYGSAITVSSSQTIKAFTEKSGYVNSAEASAAYVINVITPVAVEAFPSTSNYPTVTWTPNVKFTLGSGTTIGLYSDTSGTGINTPASASAGSNTMVANTLTSLGTSASIYAKDPAATGYVNMGSYTTRTPPSFAALGAFYPVAGGGGIKAIVKDSVSTGCATAPNCLYVGGAFTAFQHVAANYIIKIMPDGSLSTLGSGLDGPVRALALDASGNLYVGGEFSSAGGVANTPKIAKWNGSSWSALGTGTNHNVNALALYGSNLYVGGAFSSAGGVANTSKIAKWDTGTSTWSSLTSSSITEVFALGVDGSGNLYMGGNFLNLNANANADNIAKWDGSSWSAMGTGTNSQVLAITVSGSNIYAGGSFTLAGGVANTARIAMWNGTAWSALGTGIGASAVYSLTASGSTVYAGGVFLTAGGNSAISVARWDGSSWSALGSGVDDAVMGLCIDGSANLIAGGQFANAGGSAAHFIAKWNGSAWSNYGSASTINTGSVYAIATSGSNIYVGGNFAFAGANSAEKIAQWNGSTWSALGTGMDNTVFALATNSSGNLYAGGWFTTAGGVSANKIAMWDGSAWSALGTGMNGNVQALATYGSILYASGGFTSAGGVSANYIAKWNGSSWSALGAGATATVNALAIDSSGNLYAAGAFTAVDGVSANRVAKWDPSANSGNGAWSALGSGITGGTVDAIAVDNSGNLYAGGTFTTAGGIAVNKIAKWNGSVWSALGTGVDADVTSIATSGSTVVVGGWFTNAGGSAASYVAKWNGSAWSAAGGSGTNGGVYALTTDTSGNIFAGGEFSTAGGLVRPAIAKFMTLFDAWF